jgi:hypothetical protein
MQSTLTQLKPAQAEVHQAAHDQDLTEVPRRARLDREAEHNKQFPTPEDPVDAKTPQSSNAL